VQIRTFQSNSQTETTVSSTLLELTVKAKRDGKYRFRSLYREIDLRMLYESFRLLKPKAAVGVDGASWREYENDLDANLRDLLERLKTHCYRALNSRSQKKSYRWKGFAEMWKTLDISNPKIIETTQPTNHCLIKAQR